MTTTSDVRLALGIASPGHEADQLSDGRLREGSVACENLVSGVTSVFRWEGRFQRETEVLMILRKMPPRADAWPDRLVELHPGASPQLLRFPAESGHGGSVGRVESRARSAQ